MNVLVIPEDFRKDQYMLKPIITAMFNQLGKPKTKVRVCQDPLLGGISQALTWENIAKILDRYAGMIDLFLLCVDRDGEPSRQKRLQNLEEKAQTYLAELIKGKSRCLLAENAWQELEVWVLAGHDLPKEWSWQAIRQERDPKEAYFLPFAKQRSLLDSPDEGRQKLAKEAAERYDRIRQLCPEDVANLETRIREWRQ